MLWKITVPGWVKIPSGVYFYLSDANLKCTHGYELLPSSMVWWHLNDIKLRGFICRFWCCGFRSLLFLDKFSLSVMPFPLDEEFLAAFVWNVVIQLAFKPLSLMLKLLSTWNWWFGLKNHLLSLTEESYGCWDCTTKVILLFLNLIWKGIKIWGLFRLQWLISRSNHSLCQWTLLFAWNFILI